MNVERRNIPTLAGNIAATVADPNAACFSTDDEQFIKFHGFNQQDTPTSARPARNT